MSKQLFFLMAIAGLCSSLYLSTAANADTTCTNVTNAAVINDVSAAAHCKETCEEKGGWDKSSWTEGFCTCGDANNAKEPCAWE